MNTSYKITTEDFERIERYLLDELDSDKKLAFENELSNDELLALKVKEVKLLLTGIEAAGMKEQLKDFGLAMPSQQVKQPIARVFAFKRRLLLAASVIIIAAVSAWLILMKGNKYENIYASYYKPDPGLMTAMGISDNYAFNKAMVDYKTGNYKAAIDEWSRLKKDTPANDTLNYFLGAAQQAEGNSKEALGILKSISADPAKPFYKDACWYTGLALLKQGAVEEAITYLKKSGRTETTELISKLK